MKLMRSKLAVLCLAGAISVYSQTPGEREFSRAQSNIEELRKQARIDNFLAGTTREMRSC